MQRTTTSRLEVSSASTTMSTMSTRSKRQSSKPKTRFEISDDMLDLYPASTQEDLSEEDEVAPMVRSRRRQSTPLIDRGNHKEVALGYPHTPGRTRQSMLETRTSQVYFKGVRTTSRQEEVGRLPGQSYPVRNGQRFINAASNGSLFSDDEDDHENHVGVERGSGDSVFDVGWRKTKSIVAAACSYIYLPVMMVVYFEKWMLNFLHSERRCIEQERGQVTFGATMGKIKGLLQTFAYIALGMLLLLLLCGLLYFLYNNAAGVGAYIMFVVESFSLGIVSAFNYALNAFNGLNYGGRSVKDDISTSYPKTDGVSKEELRRLEAVLMNLKYANEDALNKISARLGEIESRQKKYNVQLDGLGVDVQKITNEDRAKLLLDIEQQITLVSNRIQATDSALNEVRDEIHRTAASISDIRETPPPPAPEVPIDRIMDLIKPILLSEIQSRVAVSCESRNCPEGTSLGGLTVEDIALMIKRAIAKYDADKTGLPDLALESAGGSILSTRCTKSASVKNSIISYFGFGMWSPPNTPRAIISPEVQPGLCWAFEGSVGDVVIKLAVPSVVTGFTLEHISKSISRYESIDSAPKDFMVLGLQSEHDDIDVHDYGHFTYEDNGESIQYFQVNNITTKEYPIVELKILSNHGNLRHTCVYRFRVHGAIDLTHYTSGGTKTKSSKDEEARKKEI